MAFYMANWGLSKPIKTPISGVMDPSYTWWSLTTNCRFSSHFFGGRFFASLATWFDCHLDAGIHTDWPALRALPKDHTVTLGEGGGHVCHDGSEEFCLRILGCFMMFINLICDWLLVPNNKKSWSLLHGKNANVTYLFFLWMDLKGLHHHLVLPYHVLTSVSCP